MHVVDPYRCVVHRHDSPLPESSLLWIGVCQSLFGSYSSPGEVYKCTVSRSSLETAYHFIAAEVLLSCHHRYNHHREPACHGERKRERERELEVTTRIPNVHQNKEAQHNISNG